MVISLVVGDMVVTWVSFVVVFMALVVAGNEDVEVDSVAVVKSTSRSIQT